MSNNTKTTLEMESNINNCYRTGEDLDKFLSKANNNQFNQYVTNLRVKDCVDEDDKDEDIARKRMKLCHSCKGPLIGHKNENDCEFDEWNDLEMKMIFEMIMKNDNYEDRFGMKNKDALDEIKIRKQETSMMEREPIKPEEQEVFVTEQEDKDDLLAQQLAEMKIKHENDMKIVDLVIQKLDNEKDMIKIAELTVQKATIESNYNFQMAMIECNRPKTSTNDIKITNEKQRVCPSWTEHLPYDLFKSQVENWNSNNTKDPFSKYHELLESLKKNEKIHGLREYVTNIGMRTLKDDKEVNVEKVLIELDKKYNLTANEKMNMFMNELLNFKIKDKNDPLKAWEDFKALVKKSDEVELGTNKNYFLYKTDY